MKRMTREGFAKFGTSEQHPWQAFGPILDEIFIGVIAEELLRREVDVFNGRFGWAYNPAVFNCQFLSCGLPKNVILKRPFKNICLWGAFGRCGL